MNTNTFKNYYRNRFTLRYLLRAQIRHTPRVGHQSAHKHYSGKISSPTLPHTAENRGMLPPVFLFSHKFTNSWYLRRK